ncbi:hypothetical protein TYRP_012098 [Tyrophagus putrescentiae]|nr:hypothetical protein TYRP_012098 [Tyrophagus putrescentiae]
MVKVTSEPAIEGKRMSLVRGTTHVEKVLVICLKEEAIDEAEMVAVEFTNGMIISVSKEEVKLMSDHNQMKIQEEIILQNELQLQQ